ncbi:YgiT-type zinc finger protein [Candidatus Aerophobetes bacterium]|nr:YgiT-type zinc finger protein [Candidatus Aerophobetes bacterium]
MRCVICNGSTIKKRQVDEELKDGDNVVLIPIEVLVCEQCGERYYTRQIMKTLEEIEEDIKEKKISLKEVGRVLKPSIT